MYSTPLRPSRRVSAPLALGIVTLMLLASFATFSAPGASAQSPSLTVTSQSTTGTPLSGPYWIEVTGTSGNVIQSAYTPAAFTLAAGSYVVYAGNYAAWIFSSWSDGTTTPGYPVTITNSSSISIVATYCSAPGCAVSLSGSGVKAGMPGAAISVASHYANGSSLTGMYTVLQQASATVATGYTPSSFSTVISGQTYTVTVGDYTDAYFMQWSSGLTTRTVSVTAGTTQTMLNAIYCQTQQGCSYTPPSPPGAGTPTGGNVPPGSITVTSSQLGTGAALSGMFVDLRLNNNHIVSGYTPVTFTGLQLGSKYLVVMYGYGANYFRHFSTGNLQRYSYVTLNTTVGQTAYALNALYENVPNAQAASLNIIAQFPNGTQIGTASEIGGYPQHTPGMYLSVTPPGAASPYTATFTGGSILPFIFFNHETYTVALSAGYSNITFAYWKDDGSANPTRAFDLNGNSTFIAIYTEK
jgi:hypothetical protein